MGGFAVSHYNGSLYQMEPLLLVLPWVDETTGKVEAEPVLNVKFSKDTQDTVDRKVLKIWDDHSGYGRPKSVKVHLLKDGSVYDTVTLTADNQWRYTWEDLAANALWQIAEEVPEYYSVTVEREGNTFLLINTAPELPPSETEPMEPPKTESHDSAILENPDYQYNPDMEMPGKEIDGCNYIGTLEIFDLGLTLPIMSTASMENLRKAPCRYSGSAYQQNLIIGAHNYEAHFGRLKSLSYGSEIRVTDIDGNQFAYQVADIEIL